MPCIGTINQSKQLYCFFLQTLAYGIFILLAKPALFINLRDEVFKCQEMQAPAENFDEGNSELFSNQNFRGRL